MTVTAYPAAAAPRTAPPSEGGVVPAWLAAAVTDIVGRAGGATQRAAGDGVTAVVTARAPHEFDVVLELTAAAVTLRVWGLERRHELPRVGSDDDRTAAALRALEDWLALLSGGARLVVYDRAGAARSWGVAGRDPVRPGDRRWHPAPPPSRLARMVRRWRRRVHSNRFLDQAAAQAAYDDAAAAARPASQQEVALAVA